MLIIEQLNIEIRALKTHTCGCIYRLVIQLTTKTNPVRAARKNAIVGSMEGKTAVIVRPGQKTFVAKTSTITK